jgi:PTH1 family peptidyl-tRNA hydrolase
MFSFFKNKPSGPIDFAIVGLGNPGINYEKTRHNAGFLAVDYLAQREGVKLNKLKFKSLCAEVQIAHKRVILAKPHTFMNLSGQAVLQIMNFYKLPPERVIIIFDDIFFEPGVIKIKTKGSGGGHNGVKNIIYLTGQDNFIQIKIGVGQKPQDWDLKDWVIARFSDEQMATLQQVDEKLYAAVELILNGKISEAMNIYNQSKGTRPL